MNPTDLVLVDLSSIAYPVYLTTQSDPDPNKASTEIAARVRALASGHPHVAICCDGGRTFRHDLSSSYKANRPEREAALHHQIGLACEQLKIDGFPVWSVRGFEADDLIATATARALETPDLTVLIVSQDKDLLQLVGPRVRAKSSRDGAIVDEAGVVARFGVQPGQMRDFLTIVGDSADNIKGANGIGPKKAAQLLATFDSLDACYQAIDKGEAAIPPAILTALQEFRPRLDTTRTLVTLRTDVEIPFDEIAAERVQKDGDLTPPVDEDVAEPEPEAPSAQTPAPSSPDHSTGEAGNSSSTAPASGPTGLVRAAESSLAIIDVEYERQLDPRSMRDAQTLAENMHKSRMFSAYGSAPAVLSTIMLGRELGLPAMASLRGVHIIEGRHSLAAGTMVALILRSGMAEFFRPVTFDDGTIDADNQHATFETLRKGPGHKLTRLTYTIEDAVLAGLVKEKSGWVKNPKAMLISRASSALARLIYGDLLAGLYTPEELAEIREEGAA